MSKVAGEKTVENTQPQNKRLRLHLRWRDMDLTGQARSSSVKANAIGRDQP
jgi:hypothetical protein